MDILYIIGEGCSQCNNNELRYSLRSIEKYGKGVDRVFVVGYCPEWLSDEVIKIPFKQPHAKKEQNEVEDQINLSRKHANIAASLLYAVDNSDIGDEFLVSMDDHFYIKNVDFDHYPFYCKICGDDNKFPTEGETQYRKLLAATRRECERDGLSAYYFCIHRNMHLSRKSINECRDILEADIKKPRPLETFGYLINYRYTKDKDFKIRFTHDCKLLGGCDWWMADPNKTEVISTADFKEGTGLDCLLNGLFINKSKYEG